MIINDANLSVNGSVFPNHFQFNIYSSVTGKNFRDAFSLFSCIKKQKYSKYVIESRQT